MDTQIINFPTGSIQFTTESFDTYSFEVENTSNGSDLPSLETNKSCYSFDEILADREMAEEMFPPDYFMLVE